MQLAYIYINVYRDVLTNIFLPVNMPKLFKTHIENKSYFFFHRIHI